MEEVSLFFPAVLLIIERIAKWDNGGENIHKHIFEVQGHFLPRRLKEEWVYHQG